MNDCPESARIPARHFHAILLIALFVLEAAIFYVHIARSVAPFYPPTYDQLSYYLSTYDLIHAAHVRGMQAFIEELFQPLSATGSTFVLQGGLLSLLGGANRTTILSINLIYLIALQAVLFGVIRSVSSAAFAWTGMALLLCTTTIFNAAGGIYDYRIDFSALCLYGIWCCLVVWSRAFQNTGKVVLVALAGILLVYSRFFTIIYIAGVLGALLLINIVAIWRSLALDRKELAKQRARNIVLCGVIVAAACLPRLYLSRDAIYGYYMIGHVLGEEKFIRANELGIGSLAEHLLYYPKSILKAHIGPLTWILALALAWWSFARDRVTIREVLGRLPTFGQEFVALGLAVLIPLAILTVNISKSPVVGGIATVPVILMMVLFGATIWPRGVTIRLPSLGMFNVAILAMTVGLFAFGIRGLSTKNLASRADLDRIALMATTIARYAADNHLDHISMSVDRVVDYQNASVPKLYSIEQLHRNLEVSGLLGHGAYGIFATSRDDARRLLAESDVIVLTDPYIDRSHPYPINTKIKEYWGELAQWTNEHCSLIYSTEILGIPYRVYVRPRAQTPAKQGSIAN
ncbi:hypothetical protein [Tardiphaga sp. 42S5]|uniref:hypothetical protein n=1 Tax=Tardiphaga sp. 42S5 TaxID=1404799 RepID=UPI002A59CD4B|nr:hypothetical protein [Tardiphaga sp. 42S5]WPO44261.1 hypothetical protein SFY93_14390 [Tardiphaga sp. 42S5]